jgi:hypothetical protein
VHLRRVSIFCTFHGRKLHQSDSHWRLQACWILERRPTSLAGGEIESNENTCDTILASCVCCKISSWVSESVLLGDERATKDSELVEHGYLVIEELIGGGSFSFLVEEFFDWEDREDFNGIADEVVSELGWEPCMD